jgi:citronellol/citronellal dehydrogenase
VVLVLVLDLDMVPVLDLVRGRGRGRSRSRSKSRSTSRRRAIPSLRGKTLLITGASRGIGKAIGIAAAREGANVVVAAKSDAPNPKLPGTIQDAAREMEVAGGRALAVRCDVRDEGEIAAAVSATVAAFGGIDVLVNNASAIFLAGTAETPMKRFDLMHQVNVRATFACTQACLPHLARSANPHVLVLSPPLLMTPRWFAPHVAYTMSKYGMSMCVLGMSEELRERGIAVNALWPRTIIATAALNLLGGDALARHGRTPEIVADAAVAILRREARSCTGNFFIDEDVLRAEGVTDLARYAVAPGEELAPDLFL